MADTPKRTRSRRNSRPPQEAEYKTQYQEWSAVLPQPPLTLTQLRQEYNDALSFLLLLEQRINALEEAATPPPPPGRTTAKLYYFSARARSTHDRV